MVPRCEGARWLGLCFHDRTVGCRFEQMIATMAFWSIAIVGFAVVVGFVVAALAVPRYMMGMHPDTFYLREPIMFSLMAGNVVAVAAYIALLQWVDGK